MLTSLYTGISGMQSNGMALSVIGDNIANMNTHAFKSSRVSFGDIMSQTLAGGTSQIGRGVMMTGISTDFTQGSLETTGNVLDMAVDGSGFFIVADDAGQYYTRAGQFAMDKDGNIVDPNDLKMLGYMYEAGTVRERLTDINVNPGEYLTHATGGMIISANLDSQTPIGSTGIEFDPAATNTLDDTEGIDVAPAPPAPYDPEDLVWITDINGQADYTTPNITVYDSNGDTHNVNMHFIKTAANSWNWYVEVPAAATESGNPEIQAYGTVDFDSGTGAYMSRSVDYNKFNFEDAASDQSILIDFANLSEAAAYASTPIEDGYVSFDVNNPDATSHFSNTITVYDSLGTERPVTLYFTKNSTDPGTNSTSWNWYAYVDPDDVTAGQSSVQASGMLTFDSSGNLYDIDSTTGTERSDPAERIFIAEELFNFAGSDQNQAIQIDFQNFTQFTGDSATVFKSQDGFPPGYLKTLDISQEGIITGIYTNGQTKDIAQIVLAKFDAPGRLTKAGKNLYQKSNESGDFSPGMPNQVGLGRVMPFSLELSNVDLAREFVNMITAQRGFQANSRVITVTDNLLQELVNMVR